MFQNSLVLVIFKYYHHIYFEINKFSNNIIKYLDVKWNSGFKKPRFLSNRISRHKNVINLCYTGLREWVSKSGAGYPYSFITTVVAANGNWKDLFAFHQVRQGKHFIQITIPKESI